MKQMTAQAHTGFLLLVDPRHYHNLQMFILMIQGTKTFKPQILLQLVLKIGISQVSIICQVSLMRFHRNLVRL